MDKEKNAIETLVRMRLIKRALAPFQDTCVWCPAVNNNVWITHQGIKETAHWASRGDASTILAMHAIEVLQSAMKKTATLVPKPNKSQSKIFKFSELYEIESKTEYGKAIVRIGKDDKKFILQYCIVTKEKTAK